MIEQDEIQILKKSIDMIAEFSRKVDYINSSSEFISIHNRNLETIKRIAADRNSNYLKAKLNQFPEISQQEVDNFMKNSRGEKSLVFMLTNFWLAQLITNIFQTAKAGGHLPIKTKIKIAKIVELNSEIIKVVENPYLEEVYKTVG